MAPDWTLQAQSGMLDGAMGIRTFSLGIGGVSIPTLLGRGAWSRLAELIPDEWTKTVIVSQSGIPVFVKSPVRAEWILLPDGEAAKRPAVAQELAEELVRLGVGRGAGLVALGGGVVTDLAGFVASTYMRGIEYVNAPTTLLGMVDAAIGGKTAVNLRGGKNLFGSFWQPKGLLCDLSFLGTLPEREWASGAGELAKYAFLTTEPLAELPLPEQIYAAQRLKESYVADDEREAGRRSLLNYGHTLAHGIEGALIGQGREGAVSHGEAVAVGLVFAAHLARALGRIDDERVAYHEQVLAHYGLRSIVPEGIAAGEILRYMRADKKNRESLSFVLDGPSGLELVHGVGEALVVAQLEQFLNEVVAR